jgi:hypothetical protein
MIRHPLRLLILSGLLFACGEKSSSRSDKSASAEQAEPPFTGPLTVARLMKAEGKADIPDDWSAAHEKLERFLGKPTGKKGDRIGWGVIEGDSCAYLYMGPAERPSSERISVFMSPAKVTRTEAIMTYAECTAFAGKEVGPPEDPKAVAPPTDGSSVALRTYIDNAIIGRSKWDKQRVKLSALANGINVSTANNDPSTETITVNMVADKAAATTISCTLVKGTPKPELPGAFEPLIAEGTVTISTWVNGVGDTGYSADLKDCTVTFLGKTKK